MMVEAPHKKSFSNQGQVFIKNLVFVVGWTVLFTLAYSQSPLYSSNQNQYFLHGLAKAGVGYLNQDWLGNTLDPTPVFSGLVALTYRIFEWPPIFYLYFTILAGVYFFSLTGIVTQIFPGEMPSGQRGLFFGLLITLHSAALSYIAVRVFGASWAFLFDGGVAGQRLLGSVLQPSAFGVLLLFSLDRFLRRKYVSAIILLVLTPTIHPTYLLSAAVLTCLYMGITYFEDKDFRTSLALGVSALIGAFPILIHAFITFGGSGPMRAAQAREILVDFRIPHHAIPAEWLDGSVIVKTGLIGLGLVFTRKTRLFHFLLWPFAVVVGGTLAQIVFESDVIALLFPWRLSTWLIPLSIGVIALWGTNKLWCWLDQRVSTPLIVSASVVLTLILAGLGLTKSIVEYRTRQTSADRPMMTFVRENKSPGDVYLIPLDMQDFRLETGAPVYVEFKSIPYKDMEVLEWLQRVRNAGNFYRAPQKVIGCNMLAAFYAEGVTHAVLPYDHMAAPCLNLEKLFLKINQYAVYKILDEWPPAKTVIK